MSKGVQVFRQTDVTKAVKAAQNAGLAVQRIEVGKDGKIAVFTTGGGIEPAASTNELDKTTAAAA